VGHSVKHNLLAAFRFLLRPLVRIALRNGTTFPDFADALKGSFIDVSSAQLRAAGREPSSDAISVMTGIRESELTRDEDQNEDKKEEADAESSLNAAARFLVGWHTDREYVGPYGLVQDLEFAPEGGEDKGGVRGFVQLAKRYCPGYPAEVLLAELIRTKCVEELGNGCYRAATRIYVPEQLSRESIRRFAQVVHNVIETLEFNLRKTGSGAGRIERTIFADYGLSKADLSELNLYVREKGQIFADDLDNWLSARSVQGRMDAIQTGIGIYHYVVNDEDERDFSESLKTGD